MSVVQNMIDNTPTSEGNFIAPLLYQNYNSGERYMDPVTRQGSSFYNTLPTYTPLQNMNPLAWESPSYSQYMHSNNQNYNGSDQIYNSIMDNPYSEGNSNYYNPYYNPLNQYTPNDRVGGLRQQLMGMVDPFGRTLYQQAITNRITFKEQVDREIFYQSSLVRCAYASMGLSEEEIKEKELSFIEGPKKDLEEEEHRVDKLTESLKNMTIIIRRGDEIILESTPDDTEDLFNNNNINYEFVSRKINQYDKQITENRIRLETIRYRSLEMYQNAPEREADNADLYDFFTIYAPKFSLIDTMKRIRRENDKRINQTYNKSAFAKLLQDPDTNSAANSYGNFASREFKVPSTAIRGGYGFLPLGIPVAPGQDPEIGNYISYDPTNNNIYIEAPKWIKDKIDKEGSVIDIIRNKKSDFMRKKNEQVNREEDYLNGQK